MAERCAVIGVGQTHHKSKRDDISIAGMVREAAKMALADADLTWSDIDAVVIGKVRLKKNASIWWGAVIRGDTGHYDFVAGECASGIQQVQLATGVPVVFGVLTTDTLDQALVRSEPDHANKGREAALTGIEMVRLLRSGPLS